MSEQEKVLNSTANRQCCLRYTKNRETDEQQKYLGTFRERVCLTISVQNYRNKIGHRR